ncbi:MAG: peptide MFS transporter [Candidatus Eisenbacteria bacterium]|nr:peptide MFS transporter [Candidatus Eisenbacteria bacterium]
MRLHAAADAGSPPVTEKHPKGLYVLFATEMWERFGFYSMLAMFTLYLRSDQGFHWTPAQATSLYSNYLMFVYASPLVGGWIADRWLGYRRSVLIGGLIFMVGYSLFMIHTLAAVYAALALLVIGNGFFKPNVSTMVGNLYPPGSHLKDRAYNIFYMGINIGAFFAPVVAEFMSRRFGFRPAFGVASLGMVVSIVVLWLFKRHVEGADGRRRAVQAGTAAAPQGKAQPIDAVSDARRIGALIVIYLIVIVFWMVFHQNGSTLTYWANENTRWKVSGVISNAINPFFVVAFTYPLIWFWKWLDRKGREPATPAKMGIGMLLTTACYGVMFLAAKAGGDTGKVSPVWLIGAYAILTSGELMLSPMGLSLVSKVAPERVRGLMMGGWFVATAIGNKLTAIGVYWTVWKHSTFFAVLGGMALVMAIVLFALLRPLKRAMPGV